MKKRIPELVFGLLVLGLGFWFAKNKTENDKELIAATDRLAKEASLAQEMKAQEFMAAMDCKLVRKKRYEYDIQPCTRVASMGIHCKPKEVANGKIFMSLECRESQ